MQENDVKKEAFEQENLEEEVKQETAENTEAAEAAEEAEEVKEDAKVDPKDEQITELQIAFCVCRPISTITVAVQRQKRNSFLLSLQQTL